MSTFTSLCRTAISFLVCVAGMTSGAMAEEMKLGPSDKVAALKAQPDSEYMFVFRFATNGPPDVAHQMLLNDDDVVALPVLNGYARRVPVRHAFKLAERDDYRQAWYLHPELEGLYIRTLRAIDRVYGQDDRPVIVNLSIGPPIQFWTREHVGESPFAAAAERAARSGLILVVAAGNVSDATANEGWVNPWSRLDSVISVGAYDRARGRVADFSARGDPTRPETWPDLLGDGVDVVGPYPPNLTKSEARRARDEGNAEFRERVPREKWDIYTLESGTSQAAANVTGTVGQIVHFLRGMIKESGAKSYGDPLFTIHAPPDRVGPKALDVPRLTGTATLKEAGGVEFAYYYDDPVKLVRQILYDFVRPVPDDPPHATGAGYVDRAVFRAIFSRFGDVEPKNWHFKVIE